MYSVNDKILAINIDTSSTTVLVAATTYYISIVTDATLTYTCNAANETWRDWQAVPACGTAINPKLVIGQTEGALVNGIGYALSERYLFNSQGRMLNPSFGNYKIMTTIDLPEIKTIIVPTYEPSGPFGAKSVAEININGPMPAISNAIFDAIGIRITRPPYTPEKVLQAIKSNNDGR